MMIACLCASLPGQDVARERLESSPRHGEFITIGDGSQASRGFIVYPEVKDKATAVVVIHEIFGLTDWVRSVCDQLAENGFIAFAPDMLGGKQYESLDDARRAIGELKPRRKSAVISIPRSITSKPCRRPTAKWPWAGFAGAGRKPFATPLLGATWQRFSRSTAMPPRKPR